MFGGLNQVASIPTYDPKNYRRNPMYPAPPPCPENTVLVLYRVCDHHYNVCSANVTVTGGYTIDWGDGTVDNVASGTRADHIYDFNHANMKPINAWKKCIWAKITPQNPTNNITTIKCHEAATTTFGIVPVLEVVCNLPGCTQFYLGNTNSNVSRAEYVEAINLSTSLTSLSNAFAGYHYMKDFRLPTHVYENATTLASLFQECKSIEYIDFPEGTLTNVTTIYATFSYCYMLKDLKLPASLASVTGFATDAATTGSFSYTRSLRRLTWGWPVKSMFQWGVELHALYRVEILNNAADNVTNVTSIFAANTLRRLTGFTAGVSFTLTANSFSSTELNEVYTNLPTVTSKTITLNQANAYGKDSDDPTIATAKGWTVSGST